MFSIKSFRHRINRALTDILCSRPVEAQTFSDGEWVLFADVLSQEGLLPCFYWSMGKSAEYPSCIRSEARAAYKNALLYKDLAVYRLKEMQEQLCEKGRVVVLKGLSLCETLYHEPEVRPMGDIDLYFPDGSINDVRDALLDNNFETVGSYPYVLKSGELVFDLHEDLWGVHRIAKRSSLIPPIENFFVSSSLLPGYSIPGPLLSAAHAAYHGMKHGFARKIWLLDLIKLYNAGFFEPRAVQKMNSTIVETILSHLHHSGLIQGWVAEEGKEKTLRRMLIKRTLGQPNGNGLGEILMALNCATWRQTVCYFIATLIPKKRVLQEMYGIRPYPVLVLLRIVRMISYAGGLLLWHRK